MSATRRQDEIQIRGAESLILPPWMPPLSKALRRKNDPTPAGEPQRVAARLFAGAHECRNTRATRPRRAGPPQSRLGPAPEPLPSRASLRTGKLDSCRFLSTPVDSSPHALGPARTPSSRRAAPVPSRRESTGVDRNRVARRSRPQGPAQIESIAPLRATKSPA